MKNDFYDGLKLANIEYQVGLFNLKWFNCLIFL